jgi:O-methyltransferase
LDEQVRFIEGYFEDTLPTAPVEQLAVLRVDGDMNGSTMAALESLYDKVSPGGYGIIDDFGAVRGCKQAVGEFRARGNITDELQPIDWSGVFWRKS